MKKIIFISLILILTSAKTALSQNDTTVYLITCSPGTATYSLWGHSALRVVIQSANTDIVYNWGVFDFATRNFAWKFARGRLNYMLGAYPWERFLEDYMLENRSVWSQQVNIEPVEKLRLLLLIDENLKPENKYYRYDFFYDDCSTRIRDLIEKILGSKLIYPPEDPQHSTTFREMIGKYTKNNTWLSMGVDLLMGSPGEKKTSFRDRMFLPDYLQGNLSQAVINRDRKMSPLLQRSQTVLEFPLPESNAPFFLEPIFIFSLLFIILMLLTVKYRSSAVFYYIDSGLFLIFSILSLMMIFFGFFTDHAQMKLNLSMVWFNPFILPCLWCILSGRGGIIWFRIVFFLGLLIVPVMLLLPGIINISWVPVVFILLVRASARADFSWNPMSI